MATIEEMMTAAWGAFKAGELDRAEQAYRRVLECDPKVAYAWYMVGAACHVRGRTRGIGGELPAGSSTERRISPRLATTSGVALHALRRSEEAIDVLRRALMLRPDYAEAHNNLGNALHERGPSSTRPRPATGRRLRIKPEYVEAHHNLGNALRSGGRAAEAIASYTGPSS